MTSGTLAMIACPILEDEMVYNIAKDPEEKKIYLLRNKNTVTLIPKLKEHNIEYTGIDEDDYLKGKVRVSDDGYSIIIWMMDLGLHSEPAHLGESIRDELTRIDGRVDGIALYYGLCGNGLLGILDWCKEMLKTPVTIFTDGHGKVCDDCICVPLGSSENYLKLIRRYPGVMYLTPAMACSQDAFMASQDLFKGAEVSGMTPEQYMKFMLDLADYKYALKIDTGMGDQEHFQQECENYVKKYQLELKYLEKEWISTEAADRIYSEAKSFLKE